MAIDPGDISQALRLAAGEPDLVVVDRRVLELLMPGLSRLIVLRAAESNQGRELEGQNDTDEAFVWDDPSFPCKW